MLKPATTSIKYSENTELKKTTCVLNKYILLPYEAFKTEI